MADNYIERREEELKSSARQVVRRSTPSLETLIYRNRSHRAYDTSYVVALRQLEAIVAVNTELPSGKNAQTLRFKLLDEKNGGADFCRFLHFGGYLPELHLPVPGTEPRAFIVVCSTGPETPTVDIDLGISLQSMALKAVEIGLNALIVRAFDRQEVKTALNLPLEPLAVLAIGKGIDKIELVQVPAGSDLKYYRKDGLHYVPKLGLKDIVL
ncbi:MAG: nitroreductase family protein [Bacteroidales bacterium]|nr:nitroreductase family protein [Bacteroidales bacterium]